MSLHCDWFVLCQQVLQDQASGNLTLVNCVEQVNAPMFPAFHPGFAVAARYRWDAAAPASDLDVQFRLVRWSDTDAEEEIVVIDGVWRAATRRTRVYANFPLLRLRRAERIWFRMDARVGRTRWRRGPEVPVDVLEVPSSGEQRALLDGVADQGLTPGS